MEIVSIERKTFEELVAKFDVWMPFAIGTAKRR